MVSAPVHLLDQCSGDPSKEGIDEVTSKVCMKLQNRGLGRETIDSIDALRKITHNRSRSDQKFDIDVSALVMRFLNRP